MAELGKQDALQQRALGPFLVTAVVLGLFRETARRRLARPARTLRMWNEASEISRIIDDMRAFYGTDVVGRVFSAVAPSPPPTTTVMSQAHPESGHAVDRTRQAHQRARRLGQEPLRLRAALQGSRAARARQLRAERDQRASRQSEGQHRRGHRLVSGASRPGGRARLMGQVCVGCHDTIRNSSEARLEGG